MRVTARNMTGQNGSPVVNQIVISTPDAIIFQSYHTTIAIKQSGKVYLDRNAWDYSTTTGRYRNRFLNETKKETEAKIKAGEYILTDLNR